MGSCGFAYAPFALGCVVRCSLVKPSDSKRLLSFPELYWPRGPVFVVALAGCWQTGHCHSLPAKPLCCKRSAPFVNPSLSANFHGNVQKATSSVAFCEKLVALLIRPVASERLFTSPCAIFAQHFYPLWLVPAFAPWPAWPLQPKPRRT